MSILNIMVAVVGTYVTLYKTDFDVILFVVVFGFWFMAFQKIFKVDYKEWL